jgi:RNA polymerase sigma-70 factor (ECF subfamily)
MPAAEEPVGLETDFELLQRTASGNGLAFAEFVERHQAAVFRHASCLVGHRQDAEDLLQETFLSALKAAGQFRGDASGRTWLFRIARNAALRRTEKPQPLPESDLTLEALAVRAGWGITNPESLAILADDRRRLDRALAALPRDEREMLLLREWENLSGEEAATLLGISLAAMKSRLHRARIHLAALLRYGTGGQ